MVTSSTELDYSQTRTIKFPRRPLVPLTDASTSGETARDGSAVGAPLFALGNNKRKSSR
jgi:hypothetical protein